MVGRTEVRKDKLELVKSLSHDINSKPIIGIFDVTSMPAAALQKIKYELYGKADLRSIKKSILIKSIETSDKKILKDHIAGQPGIIITEMNPFKLYSIIQKSKSNISAKAGDVAPNDIEVKAGPTDIMPGPAITTLSKAGLQSKVEGGKIAILKDKVVCKAGQTISSDLVSVLSMLKIEPIEVGLNIMAVYEDGIVYTKDVLSIDEKQVLNDMISAYHHAINLSIESGFLTKEAVPVMIGKAFREAEALKSIAKIEE